MEQLGESSLSFGITRSGCFWSGEGLTETEANTDREESGAKRWREEDQVRMTSFEPLYPSVPEASYLLFLYIFLLKF